MRPILALAAAVLLAGVVPARAADALDTAFLALRADDARVNEIGFRITTANASFCQDVRPATGLLLTDATSYRNPADIRALLGLQGDFAVQAVAVEAPAAGEAIEPGRELLAVEGAAPGLFSGRPADGGTGRLNALAERIEDVLVSRREVQLRFRGLATALRGVPACHVHFELTTDGKGAQAGDGLVQVSRAMLAETRSDNEAAFVIAHETAHIVLGHQARRKAAKKARAVVLETEREADRIAVWLMANAGYDPAVAPGFLRRRGAKGLAALFPEPYHDRAEVRARMVEGEISALRSTAAGGDGLKDWRGALTRRP